jgi:hypothetical protein
LLLAKNSLVASGFSALIRGDVLRENVKLVDHTLLPVPTEVAAAAAVASENAKITARNLANQAERESNEREYKVRLDAKLMNSLLPKAKLRLEALRKAHPLKDSAGNIIADSYDGLAEWKDLAALAIIEGSGSAKTHQRRLEEIRDNKLPDAPEPSPTTVRSLMFGIPSSSSSSSSCASCSRRASLAVIFAFGAPPRNPGRAEIGCGAARFPSRLAVFCSRALPSYFGNSMNSWSTVPSVGSGAASYARVHGGRPILHCGPHVRFSVL